MLIVLSPAKTLDYATAPGTKFSTTADFIDHSAALIDVLRKLSPAEVGTLMHISDPLAQLNATRYLSWETVATTANAKQAVLAFNGDVYEGLDAASLKPAELDYLQAHLRILSGLYGALRPLDLMQPYRLEMGTRLATSRGKDLYAYWGDTVTEALNAQLDAQDSAALINLASEEYFKVVRPARLKVPVITPIFQDWKDGRYKIISFYAKRARGLMTRYAAEHRITGADGLREFNLGGYAFDADASDASHWMFRRRITA
ncbi:peroxide stress protein YaaA [Actimicrobium sp. CCC2.4]|uniref:peroxide stress protein YaaA n=1 Tax=Actimicrobium sp. CCC2.4 TaxID=3048606 RepID=UPI002AC96D13|nr:peroxide stress protein YaaA [Actimicrobium sp. CCC2.4]MEB0134854.1 peroxide stress protein YaaA [Actimicrobium sp. CCC2.4]WPX30786.1 peroxide stress protein YaaA [Actimicrobium sp. CCC2.4]